MIKVNLATHSLYFTGPRTMRIESETVRAPAPGEVLLNSIASGISAGTELNVYRGLAPQWRTKMDPKTRLFFDAENADWTWPARYGYALVGQVEEAGAGVANVKRGDVVFAYAPHGEHAVVNAAGVIPLGNLDAPEIGVFFANLNTAYNGLLDANVPLGADVVVMGLGVIGQIVVRLLKKNGARKIVAVDGVASRRDLALKGGATHALDPAAGDVAKAVRDITDRRGADTVIEVSGAAPALNSAIRTAGFNATVVVLSWYGGTFESLHLAGEFHHNRPRVISSQIGAVNPFLGPLWSTGRRAAIALNYLSDLSEDLLGFITHRYALANAGEGYKLIDEGADNIMQVLIDYRLQ
jgi:threonine dehydrogenase-like Zn-dependent dehydrogenase